MEFNYSFKTYINKVFLRMRNKAQLFSSHTDDHFHTRLTHTLEVEAIASEITNILNKNHGYSINADLVKTIALLHDIGHTPFGHCGERALDDILNGKVRIFRIPSFRKLGVCCGFKHNINSGYLYKENTPFSNLDFEIMDGIIKHTDIKMNGLDYGLEYITNMFAVSKNYFNIAGPITKEGTIVAFSDEIAQICSDYCDSIVSNLFNHSCFASIRPFSDVAYHEQVTQSNTRKYIHSVCEYMIDKFVSSFLKDNNFVFIKDSDFGTIIRTFNNWRKDNLFNEQKIKKYDCDKSKIIKRLFKYYYLHPDKIDTGSLKAMCKRMQANDVNERFYKKNLESLDETNVIHFIKHKLKPVVYKPAKYKKLSENVKSDYRRVFEMFIRSIAIYISTMTDNYALKEYKKHCSSSILYIAFKLLTK